jgi:hypothetical protein
MIEDAIPVCLKNSRKKERIAIIVKNIFTGSCSSSPNVSSWRKNTINADIHNTKYRMIEKIFMGAVIFWKKLLGNI